MRLVVDGRPLIPAQRSGIAVYLASLLAKLPAALPDASIDLFTTGTRRPTLAFSRIEHRHVPIPNRLLTIKTLLTNHSVFSHRGSTGADLLFLPNLAITGVPRLPYALTIHDLSWMLFPEFFPWNMRLWHTATRPNQLIRRADALITPSESSRQDLLHYFPVDPARVHVVPHAVDPIFSPLPSSNDVDVRREYQLPERYILFVGTLEPRKNISLILDAVAQYREKTNDPISIVFAGSLGWHTQHFKPALNQAIREGWAHYIGYPPTHHLPTLYRGAKVLLWPSFYEGFGLPVLEAMASGTPVITSHASSLPELVQDAAILVDPFNPMDTVLALEHLLSNETFQQELARRGCLRAQAFSWENTAKLHANIFCSIKK